jgi:hypothetical protein
MAGLLIENIPLIRALVSAIGLIWTGRAAHV